MHLRQREEPPEQRIHRPISKQHPIVGFSGKRLWVHVTPICMLQISGAIDEDGRKIGAHSSCVHIARTLSAARNAGHQRGSTGSHDLCNAGPKAL